MFGSNIGNLEMLHDKKLTGMFSVYSGRMFAGVVVAFWI